MVRKSTKKLIRLLRNIIPIIIGLMLILFVFLSGDISDRKQILGFAAIFIIIGFWRHYPTHAGFAHLIFIFLRTYNTLETQTYAFFGFF